MTRVHIGAIDHLVIAVGDLDAARDYYARLGFRVTPRGRHTLLQSVNHCMMFDDDYVELMGFVGEHPVTAYYRERILHGNVLAAIALRTDDAAGAHGELAAAGLAAEPPVAFGRPVLLPDGSTAEARFEVTQIGLSETPGGRVFLCRHETPDVVWRPEYRPHPNGAQALAHVLLVALDPLASAAAYSRLHDDAAGVEAPAAGEARLRIGSASLRILSPQAYLETYPGVPDLPVDGFPRFAGLGVRVSDRNAAADLLRSSGVVVGETAEGSLWIAPGPLQGPLLELV